MESTKETTEYKGIFKSTFLFGSVQVFNILTKMLTNKAVAIILGAEGMGLIGIYNTVINFIKTGAGLGISQSAVRDISEANGSNDKSRFSKTISVTKKIILFTSLLGCLITIILSKRISLWTLGSDDYTWGFIFLSLAVGFSILNEGQLAILKGMRQLKALAKGTMIGAVAGLITAVPLYYFFGEKGIVPSLIITAFSAFIFSNYFVKKIQYDKTKINLNEVLKESSPMIRMGSALMLTVFLTNVVNMVIIAYMRSVGSLEEVGFFNAGTTILHGYFGVIITGLVTDYYPRIAAINQDNDLLKKELNRQSSVSIVMCCPLIVIFLLLLPFFIDILYSAEFYPTIDLIRYGMLGTLITIFSNQVDMILVAKFKTRLFLTISVFYRITQLIVTLIFYKYFGLIGSGISMTIMGILHMIVMTTVVYNLYKITFTKSFIKIAMVNLLFFILALILVDIHNFYIKYTLGLLLIGLTCGYSYRISKNKLGIDFIQIVKNKAKFNSSKKNE